MLSINLREVIYQSKMIDGFLIFYFKEKKKLEMKEKGRLLFLIDSNLGDIKE